MSRFINAFSQGQAKISEARRGREELYDILQQLKSEILDVTGNIIHIDLANFPSISSAKAVIADVRKLGSEINSSAPLAFREYWLIASTPNSRNNKIARLAKWKQSEVGYPCEISFDGTSYRCHNREGVEEAIAALLASTTCADSFDRLMHA